MPIAVFKSNINFLNFPSFLRLDGATIPNLKNKIEMNIFKF